MTVGGILQIGIFFLVLLALVKPLGAYMARVYSGERVFLERILGPLERLIYRLAGINPSQEMSWKTYAVAMLLFNAAQNFLSAATGMAVAIAFIHGFAR